MEQQAKASAGDSLKSEASVESNLATSVKGDSGDRPFNVYVKGFSADTDISKLEQLFSEFGVIQSCTVLCDHSGKSKQVGFVQFSCEEEASTAVKEMHGKEGYGSKPLHVALTNPKPPRTTKKVFDISGSMTQLPGPLPAAAFPVPYTAQGQPGIYHLGVPPPSGAVPVVFFPAPYPPVPYAQQPPQGVAYAQPVRQPGAEQQAVFAPPTPYLVPYAPGTVGGMMVPVRHFRAAPANMPQAFCHIPAPYPGYAWGPAYSNPFHAMPLSPSKSHFVS